eukprot:Colp12_sorted_trinity150504_noHs@32609
MATNRNYMGRIFKLNGSADFYLNLGWNTRGNQKYPEWIPPLGVAIEKHAYDALIQDFKTMFDAEALDFCAAQSSLFLCMFTAGVLSCPMIYYCHRVKVVLQRHINDIITKHKANLRPGCNMRCELLEMASATSGNIAFDQYGQRLESVFEHGVAPTWPPLGYNIIITAPEASSLPWPPVIQVAMYPPGMQQVQPGMVMAVHPTTTPQGHVMGQVQYVQMVAVSGDAPPPYPGPK